MGREAQKCCTISGQVESTMYQIDGAIIARRNLRFRISRASQRIRELEQRLRDLNAFVHTAREQYGKLDRSLKQQARTFDQLAQIQLPKLAGMSKKGGEGWGQYVKMAIALQSAVSWLPGFMPKRNPSGFESKRTSLPMDDQSRIVPYDPYNYIRHEDIMNRHDPEVYKRLMETRFAAMTEEERKEYIAIVEALVKADKRELEKFTYGTSFGEGLFRGAEASVLGLIDAISHTIRDPVETVESAYENVTDRMEYLFSNPKGAALDGYYMMKDSFYDVIEAGPGKAGHYAGAALIDFLIFRGTSKF